MVKLEIGMPRPLMPMRDKGFTLVEVLVVILIISIVSSVAILNFNRNQDHRIKTFANELVQILNLAEEQAILQPAILGLYVNDHQLQFAIHKNKTWELQEDRLLGTHLIPNGIQIKLAIEELGKVDKKQPPIIFSVNGGMTPFTLFIGRSGKKPGYAITGNVDGDVILKSL